MGEALRYICMYRWAGEACTS